MTFTLNLINSQIEFLIDKYKEYQVIDNNNYTLFRAKIKSTTLTIYKTGKVLLQGNDCNNLYNEICADLNIKPISCNTPVQKQEIVIGKSIIGTDEVGTGDFFGGIVVCASLVPNDKILELTKMGIKDSKQINDKKILELGKILVEKIDHCVLLLNNSKYNQIITMDNMNMNKIKAILHNKVINNFIEKYPNLIYDSIIIDAFCDEEHYFNYLKTTKNVNKNVSLIEKAENKYISVATSSIIARYYFLKHIDELSKSCGYELPKGASSKVDSVARKILNEKGINLLLDISKINFKNLKKAKGEN